jgi:hypothetical protein
LQKGFIKRDKFFVKLGLIIKDGGSIKFIFIFCCFNQTDINLVIFSIIK